MDGAPGVDELVTGPGPVAAVQEHDDGAVVEVGEHLGTHVQAVHAVRHGSQVEGPRRSDGADVVGHLGQGERAVRVRGQPAYLAVGEPVQGAAHRPRIVVHGAGDLRCAPGPAVVGGPGHQVAGGARGSRPAGVVGEHQLAAGGAQQGLRLLPDAVRGVFDRVEPVGRLLDRVVPAGARRQLAVDANGADACAAEDEQPHAAGPVRQVAVLDDAAAVDPGTELAAAHLHLHVVPDPGAGSDPVHHGELVDAQAAVRVHARQRRPEVLRAVSLAAARKVQEGEVAAAAGAEDQADVAVRDVVTCLEGGAEVPVRRVGREREPATLHAALGVGVEGVDRRHSTAGFRLPRAAGEGPGAVGAQIEAHSTVRCSDWMKCTPGTVVWFSRSSLVTNRSQFATEAQAS